ncbi:hypothetical protein BTM25_55600 [Actinomadura rubteroloni]|uniref:DUF2231 domain-containing protein n=1 Tax=Actinomadura rubteroloni TaxID=1926885 RepID=A0A2P4UC35_9ACTN|nr:DUF2231 domain-containing protein [Actinomadura rubteroloni]POM22610.1 hypothetical protein BTM25_55600 [Actinomadura rubteroloni]
MSDDVPASAPSPGPSSPPAPGPAPGGGPRRALSGGVLNAPLVLLAAAVVLAAGLAPVEPGEAFGLPAHPLLVHVPVVLVPLLSAAVAALAARPAWRLRFGVAAGGALVAVMAATMLAAGAGEALRDARAGGGPVPAAVAEHGELGGQLRVLVVALTVVFLAVLVLDARRARVPEPGRAAVLAGRAAAALVVVLAVLALVWVVRAGHAGAELTWGHAD